MKTRYDDRIANLRTKKMLQTDKKICVEGLLDEDDYGRIAPPKEGAWEIIPNHKDGSFYGIKGWTDNFCDLMEKHPVYVDSNDAFAGRWMYFMSKMRPNLFNPEFSYDHLKEGIEKYNIIDGIGYDAHFAPDYELGLKLGWGGILEKIRKYRDLNAKDEETKLFYDSHERAVISIQTWISNTIEEIKRKIEKEQNQELKDNLKEMLEVNENVLNNAPQTFREACQWIIWYHLASRTYNRDGAGGQLDTLLYPFYRNDKEAGILDDEAAVYQLACFLINDPIYWQMGGPDGKGGDMTNHLSYLILEAGDKVNTSLNLTIRVHDKLDQEFLKKSVELLIKNKNGWPRYSGDKALVEGYMRNGYDAESARKRIAVGCNWMSLPGLEYTMNDLVKINTARVFQIAYNEMLQEGFENASTVKLYEIFRKHLAKGVRLSADCIRFQLRYQQYNEPELILNMLSYGPLEKALDASAGGAEYYNLAIDGAGLATVADSFAALEQRIEDEEKISWKELDYHLKGNWEGTDGERVRQLMNHSDRYGQVDSRGDRWAIQISKEFTSLVKNESDEEKKHCFIPGWFSWANTVGFGEALDATPNGRFAKAPISHGANPHPGFSKDGAATSMAKSIAQIQPGYGNTAPMQLELDLSMAKEDQVDNFIALIKTHFKLGGTLINVNIVDQKKILEAHKDPSKYPDLVVRITGFTAYFAMLTPEFRQLVVDRILEN
nr:pyruvate formate lyase family protein [uncultured Marinifilum sp.]